MRKVNLILLFLLFQSRPCTAADPYSLYLKGDLSKAASAYLELAAQDQADPRPLLDAAMCLRETGRYYEAAAALVKALERAPHDQDIYSELGWLRFHQSDYDGARSAFETAIRMKAENPRAELGLASVYSNLEDKEKTLEHLVKYKQLRPDFAGVDYILAWNYMNFDMYTEAESALIEALRKDPSFTEARLPLAGIYTRQGKFDEAWNQYYRVLSYEPGHPVASKMMKVLEGKLSKQPEEIRPPFRITKPLVMEPLDALASLSSSVKIRVGIGTTATGKQGHNNLLRIKSFEGLKIVGKASGKTYAEIPPDETWTAEYEDGRVRLTGADGTVHGRFSGPILVIPAKEGGSVIFDATTKTINQFFRWADRQYRGRIELYPNGGRGIGVVNIIENELYLLGVVPSEVASQWPFESLKAQAVLARTQVLIRRARGGVHKRDGYHICDGEHCQAYKGKSAEANTTTRAVVETEGEILTYHGRPAYTFYHSNCGGWIQASKEVNGWGDVPYLVTKPDIEPGKTEAPLDPWAFHLWITGDPSANCNYPGMVHASEFRWLKIIRQKDMTFRINRDYSVGDIVNIIPLKRSPSGNVNSLRIIGTRRTVDVDKEHLIRNILGYSSLKSTLFDISVNRLKNGKVRNYWIYGGGWGHGIGMCQSGAAGLAGKYNKSYNEILDFYFPGTKISRIKYVKKNK